MQKMAVGLPEFVRSLSGPAKVSLFGSRSTGMEKKYLEPHSMLRLISQSLLLGAAYRMTRSFLFVCVCVSVLWALESPAVATPPSVVEATYNVRNSSVLLSPMTVVRPKICKYIYCDTFVTKSLIQSQSFNCPNLGAFRSRVAVWQNPKNLSHSSSLPFY